MSQIGNPFEGAATAGMSAVDGFSAALARTYIAPPDFGPGAMAGDACSGCGGRALPKTPYSFIDATEHKSLVAT